MIVDALQEQFGIVNTLAAADDFAVAFGREQIDTERNFGTLRGGLHIEGLDGGGEPIDHDGLGELLGEDGFVGTAEIAAPLDFRTVGLENFYGVVIGDAGERTCDGFEFGDVALQDFEFFAALFENAADYIEDEAFGELFDVVEIGPGHFGLYHPELCKVAAGLGFFGAEGGAKTVSFAEGHGGCFVVELTGLGEVSLVVIEVVHFEQGGGAFAGSGGEDRRIDEGEAVVVEIIANSLDDFVAHADDGVLPL